MAATSTPAAPRISGDRIVLITLAVVALLAVASGARITWEVPSPGGGSTEPAAASATTTDHGTRIAAAASELDTLRSVVRTTPATASVLQERIATLELATTGLIPVAATEVAPTSPVVAAPDAGRTAAVVEARVEVRALRELVRTSPAIGPALRQEIETLDLVGAGLVPPETLDPAG